MRNPTPVPSLLHLPTVLPSFVGAVAGLSLMLTYINAHLKVLAPPVRQLGDAPIVAVAVAMTIAGALLSLVLTRLVGRAVRRLAFKRRTATFCAHHRPDSDDERNFERKL